MEEFTKAIENEFAINGNPTIASQQKAYMRHKFDFYGIKSPKRKEVQRPFLIKKYLPPKEQLSSIVKTLWQNPHREMQYFTQELSAKYVRQIEKKDIALYEFMVTNKSWWDTIDFISVNLMGPYFKKYPEERDTKVEEWLESGNFWLQRCAILFQLKYKTDLDTIFLTKVIHRLLGSDEFFINKAIGWILREYGKTNPNWVVDFANNTDLHKLSRREGLRIILKSQK